MASMNGGQNATSTNNTFIATLKGKINGLEETCKALSEELCFYKGEIQTLREEKSELEQVLAKKTDEMRKTLVQDVIV